MSLTPRVDAIESKNVEQDGRDAKNKIINGGFDFAQRGTSFNFSGTVQDGQYLLDRFSWWADIANMNSDLSLHQDENKNWARLDCNATVGIGSSHLVWLQQFIEGNFIKESYQAGKSQKFKFKVKSNQIGIHHGYFFNEAGQTIKPFTYTIDQADVTETKIIDFDWDTTHNVDNTRGVQVSFIAHAGGTRVGLVDGWQSYTPTQLIKEEYSVLTAGNYIQITDIMLYDAEFGENAPFQRAGRNYVEEYSLCRRYTQIDEYGSSFNYLGIYRDYGSPGGAFTRPISHPLRDFPTTSFTSTGSLTALSGGLIATISSFAGTLTLTSSDIIIKCNLVSEITGGSGGVVEYTGTTRIILDAEL
jgi:hypothetical protein